MLCIVFPWFTTQVGRYLLNNIMSYFIACVSSYYLYYCVCILRSAIGQSEMICSSTAIEIIDVGLE